MLTRKVNGLAPQLTIAAEVNLTLQDGNWVVHLTDFSTSKSFTYAFYLLRNGRRVASRWYEDSPTTQFQNDGVAGRYQARVFIKQVVGEDTDDIKIFDSAVVVQDGPPYDLRC